MRTYKKLTLICGSITLFSLGICLWLHYFCRCNETDFWVNVCLAIFGSALLTALSSIVTYFNEKRSTLESFMYYCRQIIHAINKYQDSMSLEEKMKFILDYHDLDKSGWDLAYGNMDFFFEKLTKNRKYIYEQIYTPIHSFNQDVNKHAWHFRWYFDGSGKNTPVMEMFVSQLEAHLLYREEQSIPTEYDDHGKPIAFCEMTSIESKLVREIAAELNGKYYDIMYGKKKH